MKKSLKWAPALILAFACAPLSAQNGDVQATGKAASAAKSTDVAGDWLGTINLGALKFRVVFHITSSENDFTATMDSPDQGMNGLPFSSAQFQGGSLKLVSEKARGRFEGTISQDLSSLEGTWTQGAASWPLLLKRANNAVEWQRQSHPQEPAKPYPYHEEDVVYENKTAADQLAATLTIPSGKGPFPAVLLIPGSGPHDRDETIFGHKPFLVLADYLTRKGIAVLRADDRGVGKSTGTLATATTADLATDAEAGIAYLKTRPEIDPRHIGLIGHSEGGIIAPMIAARDRDVAFIVMMAGSGVPGDKVIASQAGLIAEAAGQSHEQAMKTEARQREILDLVKNTTDDASLQKALRDKFAGQIPEAQIGAAVGLLTSPWYRYFIAYDPALALRKVTCPVLALNGEKDTQVSPQQNLPAIRKALEAAGNKNFEIDELAGLNHLFQTARTGSAKEYGEIGETISPSVLEKISGWILKLNARAGAN
jgi:pimeloyl-ACP methyl ester carboxylesterase